MILPHGIRAHGIPIIWQNKSHISTMQKLQPPESARLLSQYPNPNRAKLNQAGGKSRLQQLLATCGNPKILHPLLLKQWQLNTHGILSNNKQTPKRQFNLLQKKFSRPKRLSFLKTAATKQNKVKACCGRPLLIFLNPNRKEKTLGMNLQLTDHGHAAYGGKKNMKVNSFLESQVFHHTYSEYT